MISQIWKLIPSVLLAGSLLFSTNLQPASNMLKPPTPKYAPGFVNREYGTNARWWADSWQKGKCSSRTEDDWIVFYKTNNMPWRKVDPTKIRFYASSESLVSMYPGLNTVLVKDLNPPGIRLCIPTGRGLITSHDVSKTWVWFKP